MIDDPDPQVRMQVACTLGEWNDTSAGDAIARMALANQNEPYLFAATMSSITKFNLAHVAATVAHSAVGSAPPVLYRNLMTMATAYGNDRVVEEFIGAMSPSAQGSYSAADYSAVAALLDGLDRQHLALAVYAARLKARGPGLLEKLGHVANAARGAADDSRAPLDSRLAAVQLLGRALGPHDATDVDALGADAGGPSRRDRHLTQQIAQSQGGWHAPWALARREPRSSVEHFGRAPDSR
jgi:hypothetical protein